MTVSFSEIVDALRWFWLVVGVVWVGYAWLNRVPYLRALLGVVALLALDWGLHAFADFAEQPGSTIPSDFALYSVMMLLAAIGGLTVAYLYARWRKVDGTTALEAALVCIIVGGLGGRAYQVWTNWNFYAENTDLITELAHGGFGIHGALVLGLVALVFFAVITRNSLWKLSDTAVVGLSLAQGIGWYGAALTHTHYGIPLDAAPPVGLFAPLAQIVRSFGYNFVQDLPDAYNIIAFRIPVQMLSSWFYLALDFILLLIARSNPKRPGLLFALYLTVASLASFLFGFWRGDATLLWHNLRMDQWFDLGLLIVGLALVSGQYVSGLQRRRVHVSERRTLQHA